MEKLHRCLAIVLLLTGSFTFASAQSGKIDSARFFMEEKPFELTLSSDLKNLLGKKTKRAYQPATVTLRFADSTTITEEIRIQPRGKFRLENCYMPPLYLNFKNPTSPKCHTLGKLKLVCGCAVGSDDEQLIIKEFLAYKIYNMLTPKSFRVRLVKVTYEDTKGKVKKYSQYGFLLEDVDDMAARNKCKEVEGQPYNTESTDREQMTMVAIFEFMIGNSDWSVPNYHNIKLMRPITDAVSLPYAVPYDLNHCGLVNASYALPPEELGTKSVTERVYRGFPRSMEELDQTIAVFKSKKEKIWSLINNCEWLNSRYKKEVINFLEEFYRIIDNKNSVKSTFISNARTQ
jgi:hypothetical protein